MMERVETKAEYIVRAKALLREDLRGKNWPEKVRAAARLNAVQRIAQEAMRKSQDQEPMDTAGKLPLGDSVRLHLKR